MATPLLEVQVRDSSCFPFMCFLTLFFLEIFLSMSFSMGIIAVLVSVRHLEVGIKKSPRPGQQAIRNSNRNEWSPIRSVIITGLKQN